MAESDLHRDEMARLIGILKRYFVGQKVYVTGNILAYYVEGNPKKSFSPDVMVVKGLMQRRRRTFKFWQERIVPQVVIEVTSKTTKKQDTQVKAELYASLGISEYFLFDPTHDYLDPNLKGYRLVAGEYVPIVCELDSSMISQELGLRLVAGEQRLEFFRLDNGERLLSSDDAYVQTEAKLAHKAEELAQSNQKLAQTSDALAQTNEKLANESMMRAAAEAEIARLRAALAERLSGHES